MYHVRDRNVRYYAFTCYVTKACRTPLQLTGRDPMDLMDREIAGLILLFR